MRKLVLVVLALALFCASPVLSFAADAKKDSVVKDDTRVATPNAPPTAADRAKQEKEILVANINGLRAQEIKVTILQQVVNEEMGKLRNLEAVFADQYRLDVEKFRKGSYRYDDKLGKIIEQKS